MTQFIIARCKSIQAVLLLFSIATAGLAILPPPASQATAAPAALDGKVSTATAIDCASALIEAAEPAAALALLKDTPPPTKAERGSYFYSLALAHHELGQTDKALGFIEKTISANPHFAPAYELKRQYRVDRSPIAK